MVSRGPGASAALRSVLVATDAVTPAALLSRADTARAGGDGEGAIALYSRAADLGHRDGDLDVETAAVLGLARCQEYNLSPGLLPVRLHGVYSQVRETRQRAALAAALARCWAYAGEPARARPFADEALALAGDVGDNMVLADALDAALTTYWGPDDLERRRGWAHQLADAAAHLHDTDARLQAHLWGLTVAWEVLDLPRMHREMRALELLGEESAKARFFAASRRLVLDLLRARTDTLPILRQVAERAAQEVFIPDSLGVVHAMTAYTALFAGDTVTCEQEAELFEAHAESEGVTVVRAEAALVWLGAGRRDRVKRLVGAFTADTLAGLPRDGDWLLTMQCVLEGALSVEDRSVVEDVVALLGSYEGRAVVNAGAVMFHGITDDPLSRAFTLLGDDASAERLRASALATYERIGATWWRDRLLAAGSDPFPSAGGVRVVRLQQQAGGLWQVGSGTHTGSLPALRGLTYVHTLLSNPDTDVAALDLVGVDAGHAVLAEGTFGEALDQRARDEYRRRLTDIEEEVAQAEDWADASRVEVLQEEREALLEELRAATGLGGRDRRPGSSHERARVAVRKAIVSALARVAEVDPWLGRHLRDRVHTGLVCRYETDPDQAIRWKLQA
jgi:hypothetical protein